MNNQDVGRVGDADQALVASDGAAQGVSTLTGFDPSRVRLAVRRVGDVLNMVDYGCGHFITGDNLKIMDVQILFDAFHGERADVLAFLRAEAAAARYAQANAADDHPDKLYRMGQKDGLLLAATAIKNWHHLNAASGTPTRRAETLGSVGEADGGPVAKPDAPKVIP